MSQLISSTILNEIKGIKSSIATQMPGNPALAGWSSYSQCDEDGIIRECLRKISLKTTLSKTFVEIGCSDGLENNTHQLLLDEFSGVWIDGSTEKISYIEEKLGSRVFPSLMVREEMVDKSNANSIAMNARGFLDVESVDFFSLDIDGNDLHVCKPFLDALSPKLVCVEYNAKFPPPTLAVMAYNPAHVWGSDDYFGASLQSWVDFFNNQNYALVCCNLSGANAFFVQESLLEKFTQYPTEDLYQPARYHLTEQQPGHPAGLSWIRQLLANTDATPFSAISPSIQSKPQLVAKANYGDMLVYANDEVIGRSLRESGSFQEEKISDVSDYLFSRYEFSPSLFVDIGANIGTHSIFSLKKGICKDAIVFEPDPDNFQLLKKNVAINSLSTQVQLFQIALSNSCTDLEMELSNFNFGDHRIRPSSPSNVSFGEETDRTTRKIPATTLDSFVQGNNQDWTSAFVWMDTQGHEGYIFDGGQQFFRSKNGPRFIVSEFWPYGIERSNSKALYFDFIKSCAKVYDINQANWQESNGVNVDQLHSMYEEMLSKTEKEHHPHTDLLLVLNDNERI